jgi:tRNA(Ile)-lysidine synthase
MNSPGNLETPARLVESVGGFIASHDLIDRGNLVLVAFSGGADSTVLLSILHRLSGQMGFSVAAAHFNHRLRPEAEVEERRAERFVLGLGIPFYAGSDDVRSIASATGDSLEEAARKARYRFLERTARDRSADRIATGHTRSDHVETVLMRIVRGTGLRGLSGIPARRGSVIRPLLGVTHEEILAYCNASGLSFTEDPTNEDVRFFRNRVRLELLPLLESDYHPGVRDNLARLAESAGAVLESVRARTGPIATRSFERKGPGRWELDVGDVVRLDELAIVVLFGDLFAGELACDMDFTRVHYGELVRLVQDPRASGKSLSLPGLAVKREHGKIVILRAGAAGPEDAPSSPAVEVALPGETETRGLVVSTRIVDRRSLRDADFGATPSRAYFDLDRLSPPLEIREPRPGDRIQPFGMSGTKKLSDIFIDKKIPASSRPTSLVITDSRDILWLVGLTTSERCRVGPATERVVTIHVQRASSERSEGGNPLR